MFDSNRLFTFGGLGAVAAASLSLALVGCDKTDDGPHPKPPPGAHVHSDHDHGDGGHVHDDDDGHDEAAHVDGDGHDHADHAHDEGDGHDHADHAHDEGDGHDHDDHAHDEGDGHDHDDHAHGAGVRQQVSADAFGGRAMRVEVSGAVVPGGELHVEGEVVSDLSTDSLLVWVGDASSVGSRKARAAVTNGHFHVHVEVPGELPAGSALWFEHIGSEGERQTVSVSLPVMASPKVSPARSPVACGRLSIPLRV